MIMKYRIVISVCLIFFLLFGFWIQPEPISASGNIYYVAKNGSNSNPGTEASPWLTIQKAASTMVAGDITYVKSGTYNEQVIINNKSGSASSPITLEAYPGATVIIDGTGLNLANGTGLIYFYGVNNNSPWPDQLISYWNIEGFTIANSNQLGVTLYRSTGHINLQNLTIYNCVGPGIEDYSSDNTSTNITIDGCTVYNVCSGAYDECISMQKVNGFEIKNCKVYSPSSASRCGIDLKLGCANGLVHNNEVYNCTGAGIYIDAFGVATSNISIYNNSVHNNAQEGITLSDESGLVTVTNIVVYNNLIYNNAHKGFGIVPYGSGTVFNFAFVNNTLYHNSAGPDSFDEICVGPPHTQLSGCIVRNNIVVSATSNAYGIQYDDYANGGVTVDHNLFYNSGGSWNGRNILGTNYVVGNPLLNNPTTDFSLQYDSPALDAGSSVGAPSDDYVVISRPQGAGYDIGAYLPLVVTTNSLLNGTIGLAYSQTLMVTGGTAPYTWTVVSGTLPAGLSLSSSGVISGTPTSVGGLTSFTFQVTDSASAIATKSLSITINAPPSISTISLPHGTAGVAYSQTLIVTGGTAPYTWTLASGTLPAGLSLSSSGVISGIPASIGGPTSVTFQVTDSNSLTATKVLSITLVYTIWDILVQNRF